MAAAATDDLLISKIAEFRRVPLAQLTHSAEDIQDEIVRQVVPRMALPTRPSVAAFNSAMPPTR
jgi:FXSXX-COOH protein